VARDTGEPYPSFVVEPTSILITGAALITPLGLDLEATWRGMRAGRCGIGPLSAIEQPLPAGGEGGQCPDLPTEWEPTHTREVRYLRRAIRDVLTNAGFADGIPYAPGRCGILLGTTLHGMRAAGQFLRSGRFDPLADFLAGSTLAHSAGDMPLRGLAATTCSACSSSLGSIAMAVSLLRTGALDLVLAGGYDTISEYVYAGFNSLRLVAAGPLRPFTKGRQGMKLAEGYGIVALERAEDADRQGKQGLAAILGYGESADAHHLTQPHPQGDGAARAIQGALSMARMEPGTIDLIAAHATGTPDNDAAEHAALARVFGTDLPRVPVVAFKSHLGHTLGGAGAVELILSALCLRDQVVPPCPNVRPDEIEFPDLRVSTTLRSAPLRATLNTSLGFGGANTCMILGPVRSPAREGQPAGIARSSESDAFAICQERDRSVVSVNGDSDVLITGIGVVLPGAVGNDTFVRLITSQPRLQPLCDSWAIPESQFIHLLNARRVRRMSDYVKLSLAATMLACGDAGIDDMPAFAQTCSAILGSTHGSAGFSEQYYRQIVEEGIAAANPMLFAEGVPNSAAAHLSLMLSLKGPCQTVIGTRTAGLDALRLAALRIAAGEWDRAIVSAAEEYVPLVNSTYGHWGLHRETGSCPPFGAERRDGGFAVGAGAVTFVLESRRSSEQRGVAPRGCVLGAFGPAVIGRGSGELRQCTAVMRGLGHVLSSANGTGLDRLESAALRTMGGAVVSSLAGHVAETFSAMPLAGIAAVLLSGRLPRLLNPRPRRSWIRPTAGDECPEVFGVLASDYQRLLSGARIARGSRSDHDEI
jgi:3-oxoacyl-[acyl-carrier-protein] synthase II